jgi:hypothetical protein
VLPARKELQELWATAIIIPAVTVLRVS